MIYLYLIPMATTIILAGLLIHYVKSSLKWQRKFVSEKIQHAVTANMLDDRRLTMIKLRQKYVKKGGVTLDDLNDND